MTTGQQIQDRRASVRSRCLKGARIVLANGNSTLACRIRNQSQTGFRLLVDQTGYVSQPFTLVPNGAKQGETCKVTWRSPTEIGVEVIAKAELQSQGYNRSEPLMRMRKQQTCDRYPV